MRPRTTDLSHAAGYRSVVEERVVGLFRLTSSPAPGQSALERSAIARAGRSPVSPQLLLVKGQQVADRQVFDSHFAR
jgi:hypothetical protein